MKAENWNSKLGVILAVAGSAVGLGNFLKFPGLVAEHGGAAFMIAYVISFFLVGVPISIVEWTLGRRGGSGGYHSAAGLLGSICKSKRLAYFGIVGAVLTMIIYCYYIYIEAWCLGYAYYFLVGNISFSSITESGNFFVNFVGATNNGDAVRFSTDNVMIFFLISFVLNFYIIYKGVSGGIEAFCKIAMPTLIVIAIVIVIRMMTLGVVSPEYPERSINQGLGFMWNPVKVELMQRDDNGVWKKVQPLVGEIEIKKTQQRVNRVNAQAIAKGEEIKEKIVYISIWRQLLNPSIWIAAAGQVFFSLTVGFSAIMTYASYLKKKDDIVLSSISSCSTNEFFEVCLGGMITVPAAVAFFGVAGAVGAGLSLFDLGFKVLPLVFFRMPFGEIFGFLFFFLLYISAITSSISMLFPSVAFLEEATGMRRSTSTPLLGLISFFISLFVVYFSKDLKAMDTMDFWMGQVTVYIFAMVQTILFAWVFGAEKGRLLANEGSLLKLPKVYSFIIKYITPVVLLAVFLFWLANNVFGIMGNDDLSPYILDLFGKNPSKVACISVAIIACVYFFYALILYSSRRYDNWKEVE
ncbi:MAG: sodium:calcium symporter [Opitutales bacterium]|nr:sodium:calcium symporter [Opitutales bacterium]